MYSKIYETIDLCRICKSSQLEEFLDLGSQPPANSLRKLKAESPPLIPLRLLFCKKCNTVQLGESVDPDYLFSKYIWVTGTSETAKHHSRFFYEEIKKRTSDKKKSILEIASNDGTFLKEFQKNGDEILGVDPAKNIAEIATKNGIPTVAEFFSEDIAKKIRGEKHTFDVVFARNVLPHVKNIHSVVSGINILLKNDGVGAIEFHNADLILKELHYDSIYHEHLFYFSIQTLTYLLSLFNLETFDLMPSPISGGSWIIYFSKNKKIKSNYLIQKIEEEKNTGVNKLESWIDFAIKTKNHKKDINIIIGNYKGNIVGYGASARSSTLLNFCNINNKTIKYIVDNNKLKHNLVTPGSNIDIVSIDRMISDIENIDLIFLLAWNFENEILDNIRQLGYQGKILVPLPNKVKII